MRWTIDCATDATAIGCLPWSKVNGLQASAADSGTSLVHTGHEPLGFSSGVTVRTGAVTLRSDANGSPALDVGGQFTQGDPGLGAASGECGLLDGIPGDGAGLVTDLDGSPACDQAAARQLDSNPTGTTAGLAASTNPVTAVPTTCTTPVVTFAARTYNAAETAAISIASPMVVSVPQPDLPLCSWCSLST